MTPLKLESASALVKLKLTSACRGHRSDNFSEFVIFLMGQHKHDVTSSNDRPTCDWTAPRHETSMPMSWAGYRAADRSYGVRFRNRTSVTPPWTASIGHGLGLPGLGFGLATPL